MPHPMENKVNVHLQTQSTCRCMHMHDDTDVPAIKVLDAALLEIQQGCDHIQDTFDRAVTENMMEL